MYRTDKARGSLLDKPNTHRLLELVMCTFPMYGHGSLCSELLLEHTHQLFKGWLQRNTHPWAHITAMEKALEKDWMSRLSSLHNIWLRSE